MELADIYAGLGLPVFRDLLKQISLGKLKTFQMFERIKVRLHLTKLNAEVLQKSAPRQFDRITKDREVELATELAQAVLVCHMGMIVDVLNLLGVPHQDGFFEKDANLAGHLSGDWQQKAWSAFETKYPKSVLAFYLNHLAMEVAPDLPVFVPAGLASK